MKDVILEFRDFGFQYNAQSEPTLKNINLSVRKGEKILIAGPSGCGKSTLAHCINGLIPFSYRGESTGSLTLFGKEASEQSIFEISQHVGTVLQDSDGQFIGLTVAEDIAFALENDCVGEPELHEKVLQAAQRVSIAEHLNHAPNEISGGQKQRVSLAGVMVDSVELLLFDEPLANLDPATGRQTIELIDEIQKQTGAAVIIIEHRLEDVLHRPVDRVVLMDKGRIIADSGADALLCGSSLTEIGIREPLYLTVLKYAGVEIRPEMHPGSLKSIQLSQEDKALVRRWFRTRTAAPAKPKGETILEAEGLSFAYANGHQALKDITICVQKGELIAIAGANGAGKSTLSKVICGFETQQQGMLRFHGENLEKFSVKERADRIGYVMQNPNQMISKTMIYDEVALGLRCRGCSEEEIKQRVEKTLKICGLWPFRKWPVSALSYGQKKRMTVASILVLEPEVIILDEPTAGQDYRHYTEIMKFLEELNAQGITVLLITHDMHLMLEYAQRALVFSGGKLIADDSSAAILTSPAIVQEGSLRVTSLYELAWLCGIDDTAAFVQCFIDYEREMRGR